MVQGILDIFLVQGIHQVFASQCWHKSMTPLMDRVREVLQDTPVYCSIDIDGIDCAKCPGTGEPAVNPVILD